MFKLFRSLLCTFCLMFMLAATAFAAPVQVEPSVQQQYPDIQVPVVTVPGNPDATSAINIEIERDIDAFISQSKEYSDNNEGLNDVSLGVSYTVTCNDDAVLSIVLAKYINVEHAAHPMHYINGLSFNPQTGEKIVAVDLKEFSAEKYRKNIYTPELLTDKLAKKAAANDGLIIFDDILPLSYIPEQFYFDADRHVHFLFQPYEIAPYACGVIDVDMDTKSDDYLMYR
ncbi:DUF3298 domain-containing protein [Anaerovibrio sp.]|uniref:DUF3298 and DUF4163 domain-containing protein n=1 Tax=Anaerovibrio sp. TaxID=1872532 RepID=UPI003F18EFC1